MTRPGEFRAVLRHGHRASTPGAVVHVLRHSNGPSRFGFIVAKSVGGAVERNRVKRRLRSVCRELLLVIGDGNDVVIRALPSSAHLEFAELRSQLTDGIRRAS